MSTRRQRRGASLFEFALMIPMVTLVLFAITDLSAYITQLHIVGRAARDGARVGSVTLEGVDATGAQIEAAAYDQAVLVLESTGHACLNEDGTVDESLGCEIDADWIYVYPYHLIRVTVTYPMQFNVYPTFPGEVVGTFTMMTQQQ